MWRIVGCLSRCDTVSSWYVQVCQHLRNVVQTNDVLSNKAEIVVITHSVSEANLQMALQILRVLPVVEAISCVIRVEDSHLA